VRHGHVVMMPVEPHAPHVHGHAHGVVKAGRK